MTFNLSITQAWVLFLATCATILIHVVSTTWIGVQARRSWNEAQDRKMVEARALDLIAYAREHSQPMTAQNEKGQYYRKDIEDRRFRLGDDRLLDRAALLAKEWGALTLRWDKGVYEVRLRSLNDAPDQA
jgi:hypothetical protein